MKPVKFCTREQGLEILAERNREKTAFDVSSYAPLPFRMFSPFFFWKDYGLKIPVPIWGKNWPKSKGWQKIPHSYSVEGIWQGLKIINGKTNFDLFKNKPHKRPNKEELEFSMVEGFVYGDNIIKDYVEARKKIFANAYRYMYENFEPLNLGKNIILENLTNGIEVFLYDVDDNPNIENLNQPYSHASLLCDLINKCQLLGVHSGPCP
ncbi:hypothetical protein HYX19_05305 [Candidatus Woesearchaeota archaeon]|nr:hypothetical protein [Candidatus Woesearchaeota archaeon]